MKEIRSSFLGCNVHQNLQHLAAQSPVRSSSHIMKFSRKRILNEKSRTPIKIHRRKKKKLFGKKIILSKNAYNCHQNNQVSKISCHHRNLLFSISKNSNKERRKIKKKQKLCSSSGIKYTRFLKDLAGCYSLRPVKKITEAK